MAAFRGVTETRPHVATVAACINVNAGLLIEIEVREGLGLVLLKESVREGVHLALAEVAPHAG